MTTKKQWLNGYIVLPSSDISPVTKPSPNLLEHDPDDVVTHAER